jgi:hypothetical protein
MQPLVPLLTDGDAIVRIRIQENFVVFSHKPLV